MTKAQRATAAHQTTPLAPARPAPLRVAKEAPPARVACPVRGYAAGTLADLGASAPGDALGEAFRSPLAGDTPVPGLTVAEVGAGGDVAAPPALASRGGHSWPRLGWGAFVLGGLGVAGASHYPGGVPATALPPGSVTSPPSPPDFVQPVPPTLPGSVPAPTVPPPGDTSATATTGGTTPTPPTPPPRVAPPDVSTTVVPEPASAMLLVAGFAVAGGAFRRTWRR